jgi:hypothetical protein
MGVREILKITVDDLGTSSHSDETIENALEGFEIETWNWKREDIPSHVIANSTSAVKELTLYCSGNRNIINGWCGNQGFGNELLFPEVCTRQSLTIRSPQVPQ